MLSPTFTYSDIPFFISANRFTGDLNLVKDLNAIRQSIKNIILTDKGERPFNYPFGTNTFANMFDNFTLQNSLDLQRKIFDNLKLYENRIEVTNIRVSEANTKEPNGLYTLNVVIFYNIPIFGVNDVVEVSIMRNR